MCDFRPFPTSYFFVVDAAANISSVARNAKSVPSVRRVNALIVVSISFRFQKTNGLCTSALNPFFSATATNSWERRWSNVKKNVISYTALRTRLSLCCDNIFFSSNTVQRCSIARNRFGNGKKYSRVSSLSLALLIEITRWNRNKSYDTYFQVRRDGKRNFCVVCNFIPALARSLAEQLRAEMKSNIDFAVEFWCNHRPISINVCLNCGIKLDHCRLLAWYFRSITVGQPMTIISNAYLCSKIEWLSSTAIENFTKPTATVISWYSSDFYSMGQLSVKRILYRCQVYLARIVSRQMIIRLVGE